jgi:hypothetical protein
MVRAKRLLSGLALGCGVQGCGVQGQATPIAGDVPFACRSDEDCGSDACLTELGICTRREGQLTTLLFEVTPQASDPVYGGARFLKILSIGDAVDAESPLELNVRPRVPVVGRVLAAPDQAACLRPIGLASSTLPVTLTFTPRERHLGLSLPSYELSTTFNEPLKEYTFSGSLPPGGYDVYMQPQVASLGEDCRAIPQLFRNQTIEEMSGSDLRLQQPPPASLRLTIAWQDNLEGWLLDMIHPVTGEIISNRVQLSVTDVDPIDNSLKTTLNYSRADNEYMEQPTEEMVMVQPAEELVRLTPPPEVFAGTVLLERVGIELVTRGEGVIGNVSTFGPRVDFQAWVWKKDAPDTPVSGNVSFSALEDEVLGGDVIRSFEASAAISPQGQVKLPLLPGRYRIRVTPPGIEVVNLGLLAGFESSVTVWPPSDGSMASQSGQVIEVPPAVVFEGRVVAAGSKMPIRGVEVRASASSPDRDSCRAGPERDSAMGCEPERDPVLDKARAQDPFVPRTRNGISQGDGRFVIDGLDCGQCEAGASARFDLSVRPHPETGLPWLVRTSMDLSAIQEMDPLQMPMPVVRRMRVTYGDPITDPGNDPINPADDESRTPGLAGALVRVFALMDDQSRLAQNTGLPVPCVALPAADSGRCLQSLLQVAEVRSDTDGALLLLLPPDVE